MNTEHLSLIPLQESIDFLAATCLLLLLSVTDKRCLLMVLPLTHQYLFFSSFTNYSAN